MEDSVLPAHIRLNGLFNFALDALNAQNPDECISLCMAGYEITPDFLPLISLEAQAHLQKGDYYKSFEKLEFVLIREDSSELSSLRDDVLKLIVKFEAEKKFLK